MRLFSCPACRSQVFFDNLFCTCGSDLVFDPHQATMRGDAPHCSNRAALGCNWMAEMGPGGLCKSCAMTRTRPDLAVPANEGRWQRAEAAKRWVLANLADLGWFTAADDGAAPIFDLMSEEVRDGAVRPVMGHADGVITINLAEASPDEIVSRREAMGERYRTLIGHFRHELAHFLHWRLAVSPEFLDAFRDRFGDERADYGAALDRHYASMDDGSWQAAHITRYASSHPHEDWAETLAHVLHLTDILDSARAVGLVPDAPGEPLSQALALGVALNHVNRSMGVDDLYPFVVTPVVREKLDFARHHLDRSGRARV